MIHVVVGKSEAVGLSLVACLAGAAAGAILGAFSSILYFTFSDVPERQFNVLFFYVGLAFGAVAGVIVGLFWARRMVRRARIGKSYPGRTAAAGGWGVVSGIGASLITHGALIVTYATVAGGTGLLPSGVLVLAPFALLFGSTVGLVVGLICSPAAPRVPGGGEP